MEYFPFYIDIENKNCVVVGGGTVALRKIEKLLPFSPKITVIAPKICDEIIKMEQVQIYLRKFEDDDLTDAFMVISATDDKNVNEHIFKLCQSKNILINTVDDIENCGFIFPALVKRKDITVGISTCGKSPLYARFLRQKIERSFDDDCDKIVDVLSRYRLLVKGEIDSEEKRKLALEQILDICLNDSKSIDESRILHIIEDLK